MMNIVRRMRQELDSESKRNSRERDGGGLGGWARQTQSHGDNIALEEETHILHCGKTPGGGAG